MSSRKSTPATALTVANHPLGPGGRRRRSWPLPLIAGPPRVLRNFGIQRGGGCWHQGLALTGSCGTDTVVLAGVEYLGGLPGHGALFQVSEEIGSCGASPDTMAAWHVLVLGMLAATPEARRAGGLLVRLPGMGFDALVPWDHRGCSAGVINPANGDRLLAVRTLPIARVLARVFATATWPDTPATTPWSAATMDAWFAELSHAHRPENRNEDADLAVLLASLDAACRERAITPGAMLDLLDRTAQTLPDLLRPVAAPWLSATDASSDGIRLQCNLLASEASKNHAQDLARVIHRPWSEFLDSDLPTLANPKQRPQWPYILDRAHQGMLDAFIARIPAVAIAELTPAQITKLLASPKGPVREWTIRALAFGVAA